MGKKSKKKMNKQKEEEDLKASIKVDEAPPEAQPEVSEEIIKEEKPEENIENPLGQEAKKKKKKKKKNKKKNKNKGEQMDPEKALAQNEGQKNPSGDFKEDPLNSLGNKNSDHEILVDDKEHLKCKNQIVQDPIPLNLPINPNETPINSFSENLAASTLSPQPNVEAKTGEELLGTEKEELQINHNDKLDDPVPVLTNHQPDDKPGHIQNCLENEKNETGLVQTEHIPPVEEALAGEDNEQKESESCQNQLKGPPLMISTDAKKFVETVDPEKNSMHKRDECEKNAEEQGTMTTLTHLESNEAHKADMVPESIKANSLVIDQSNSNHDKSIDSEKNFFAEENQDKVEHLNEDLQPMESKTFNIGSERTNPENANSTCHSHFKENPISPSIMENAPDNYNECADLNDHDEREKNTGFIKEPTNVNPISETAEANLEGKLPDTTNDELKKIEGEHSLKGDIEKSSKHQDDSSSNQLNIEEPKSRKETSNIQLPNYEQREPSPDSNLLKKETDPTLDVVINEKLDKSSLQLAISHYLQDVFDFCISEHLSYSISNSLEVHEDKNNLNHHHQTIESSIQKNPPANEIDNDNHKLENFEAQNNQCKQLESNEDISNDLQQKISPTVFDDGRNLSDAHQSEESPATNTEIGQNIAAEAINNTNDPTENQKEDFSLKSIPDLDKSYISRRSSNVQNNNDHEIRFENIHDQKSLPKQKSGAYKLNKDHDGSSLIDQGQYHSLFNLEIGKKIVELKNKENVLVMDFNNEVISMIEQMIIKRHMKSISSHPNETNSELLIQNLQDCRQKVTSLHSQLIAEIDSTYFFRTSNNGEDGLLNSIEERKLLSQEYSAEKISQIFSGYAANVLEYLPIYCDPVALEDDDISKVKGQMEGKLSTFRDRLNECFSDLHALMNDNLAQSQSALINDRQLEVIEHTDDFPQNTNHGYLKPSKENEEIDGPHFEDIMNWHLDWISNLKNSLQALMEPRNSMFETQISNFQSDKSFDIDQLRDCFRELRNFATTQLEQTFASARSNMHYNIDSLKSNDKYIGSKERNFIEEILNTFEVAFSASIDSSSAQIEKVLNALCTTKENLMIVETNEDENYINNKTNNEIEEVQEQIIHPNKVTNVEVGSHRDQGNEFALDQQGNENFDDQFRNDHDKKSKSVDEKTEKCPNLELERKKSLLQANPNDAEFDSRKCREYDGHTIALLRNKTLETIILNNVCKFNEKKIGLLSLLLNLYLIRSEEWKQKISSTNEEMRAISKSNAKNENLLRDIEAERIGLKGNLSSLQNTNDKLFKENHGLKFEIESIMKQLEQQRTEHLNDKRSYEAKLSELEKRSSENTDKFNTEHQLNKNIQALETANNQLSSDLSMCEAEIKELTIVLDMKDKEVKNCTEKLSNLKQKIINLVNNSNTYSIEEPQISQFEAKFSDLTSKVNRLVELINSKPENQKAQPSDLNEELRTAQQHIMLQKLVIKMCFNIINQLENSINQKTSESNTLCDKMQSLNHRFKNIIDSQEKRCLDQKSDKYDVLRKNSFVKNKNITNNEYIDSIKDIDDESHLVNHEILNTDLKEFVLPDASLQALFEKFNEITKLSDRLIGEQSFLKSDLSNERLSKKILEASLQESDDQKNKLAHKCSELEAQLKHEQKLVTDKEKLLIDQKIYIDNKISLIKDLKEENNRLERELRHERAQTEKLNKSISELINNKELINSQHARTIDGLKNEIEEKNQTIQTLNDEITKQQSTKREQPSDQLFKKFNHSKIFDKSPISNFNNAYVETEIPIALQFRKTFKSFRKILTGLAAIVPNSDIEGLELKVKKLQKLVTQRAKGNHLESAIVLENQFIGKMHDSDAFSQLSHHLNVFAESFTNTENSLLLWNKKEKFFQLLSQIYIKTSLTYKTFTEILLVFIRPLKLLKDDSYAEYKQLMGQQLSQSMSNMSRDLDNLKDKMDLDVNEYLKLVTGLIQNNRDSWKKFLQQLQGKFIFLVG